MRKVRLTQVKKPKHIAQIFIRKEVCRTRKEQRIKEGYYHYPGESYYESSHENKLVYTYVLKTFKKIFIR
jgi:phage pi2 protein 07